MFQWLLGRKVLTAPLFACLRGRRLMRPDSISYAIITGSYLFQWFCSGFTSASKCVVVQLHVIWEKIKDFTWPHFAGESSPQGFPVVTSKYVCFAYLFFLRSCSSMISFKADTSGKRCDHVVRACNDFNISSIYILSLSIIWSSFLIPGSLGSGFELAFGKEANRRRFNLDHLLAMAATMSLSPGPKGWGERPPYPCDEMNSSKSPLASQSFRSLRSFRADG